LEPGPHIWWVQTWNEVGYDPWSTGLEFWVGQLDPPGLVMPIAPIGVISQSMPSYAWGAVGTASWYRLWVDDPLGVVVNQWYKSADVCDAVTRVVTPTISLTDGPHVWWVRPWNVAGYGPWSVAMNFTVGAPTPPGAATLISPTGVISDRTPGYAWG
jgi:hypothetical protein